MDRGAWWATMGSQRVGHDLATEQQQQPSWLNSKESFPSTGNEGDVDLISGSGSSPGGGHGNPLQYSCLENPCEQRNLVGHGP